MTGRPSRGRPLAPARTSPGARDDATSGAVPRSSMPPPFTQATPSTQPSTWGGYFKQLAAWGYGSSYVERNVIDKIAENAAITAAAATAAAAKIAD